MANFICKECGYRETLPDSRGGKYATCPKCRKTGQVSLEGIEDRQQLHGQTTPDQQDVRTGQEGTKDCPFCAEPIAMRAIKCKHCGSMLNGSHTADTAPESTLAEIAANVFLGNDAVSGRLQITNKRLVFLPQGNLFQASGVEIAVSDIQAVETCNTWGFIANGLRVVTKNGIKYHFVVWNRDKWRDEILKLVAHRTAR